ncbi:hypothetical protein LEP1GSC192_2416 [Leptospira sp. B5-022]|nr:hypothetical protein LEP1GSC192_2416 [Leptospira sp. B5-022]
MDMLFTSVIEEAKNAGKIKDIELEELSSLASLIYKDMEESRAEYKNYLSESERSAGSIIINS